MSSLIWFGTWPGLPTGGGFAWAVPADHAEITFQGWGTVEITGPIAMVTDNRGGPAINPPGTYRYMFSMFDPGWMAYDLTTPQMFFDADPTVFSPNKVNIDIIGELSFIRVRDVKFTARVPEPASMALFAVGGGLIYWRRRRRRA